MKFSEKISLMIILKATKYQGSILSLKNKFIEKLLPAVLGLIEYSEKYSKTSGGLWKYCRD